MASAVDLNAIRNPAVISFMLIKPGSLAVPAPDDRHAQVSQAAITATMDPWMLVEAYGDECLYGFARWHPRTGGLSWVLSTPVVEISADEARARTLSGRAYSLGRRISIRQLDEEGHVALRLLVSDVLSGYPGNGDDAAWVTSQKMARHLELPPPRRGDPDVVKQFLRAHYAAYLALRNKRS